MAIMAVVGEKETTITYQLFIPVYSDGAGRREVYSPTASRDEALEQQDGLIDRYRKASWIEVVETTTVLLEVIR